MTSKSKTALSVVLLASLLIAGAVSIALTKQEAKNTRRVEWVDENGKKHVTITSGSPVIRQPAFPASTPAATVVPQPQPAAPAAQPTQAPTRSSAMPGRITTKVLKVVSPDTFIIEGNKTVRYVGLTAPDEKDPSYKSSLEFHKKVIEGKYVNILFDSQPTTPDGTLLGFVFINQLTFVNADLIRFGHARAVPQPPNVKYEPLFKSLEERARSRNLGIWKD